MKTYIKQQKGFLWFKKRPPRKFHKISALLVLFLAACAEIPLGDLQPTNLNEPVSTYIKKPSVFLLLSFQYVGSNGRTIKDDVLKGAVEKVISANNLFGSYSISLKSDGDDEPTDVDYKIELNLSNAFRPSYDRSEFIDALKATIHVSSLGFVPVWDEKNYRLDATLYDSSNNNIFNYVCFDKSAFLIIGFNSVTNNPPPSTVESMVRDALFKIINESPLKDAYVK